MTQKTPPKHFMYGYNATLHYYSQNLKKAERIGQDAVDDVQRNLGSTDLFFLMVFILKRTDLNKKWLFERCREVQLDPDGHLDLWAREHYKENRLSEPVFTPIGWRKFGDLEVGDEVFSPNGNHVKVLARTPIQSDPIQYEISFSTFQDDITHKICAGSQHLWDVLRENRSIGDGVFEEETISSQEIFEYTATAKERKKKRWLRVNVAAPLELSHSDLVVEPYTLGVWLGDGTCRSSSITNCSDDLRSKLEGEIRTVREVGNTKVFSVIGLISKLKKLGLGHVSSKEKFIPDTYKTSSVSQRLKLIQGLMDTDGHIDRKGRAKFHTTSETLANDFSEIIGTLGIVPHIYKSSFCQDGKDKFQFVVTFSPDNLDVVTIEKHKKRLKKKELNYNFWYIKDIKRVESQPARCIQVEGGKYIIGKGHIPTHNSTIITFGLTIFDIINDPEITVGIFSHTKAIARDFVRQIKTELENNNDLPRLWPDIFYNDPARASKRWSIDNGIVVKRKQNPKEATVEGHGLVDGMPTGKHFKGRVYDDVVTKESVSTPEQMAKTTDARQV